MRTAARSATLAFAVLAASLAGCNPAEPLVPEAQADSGRLTLVKPADVTLVRGTSQTIAIQIRRDGLPNAVRIRFTNLPRGVAVPDEDAGLLGDAGNFTLLPADGADLVVEHPVTVVATGEGGATAQESFLLTVRDR